MAFKMKSVNKLLGLHEQSNGLDNVIKEVDMPNENVWGYVDQNKTIFINKNLSDSQKAKAIKHETVHKEQIKSGKLMFDSNNFYWRDTPTARVKTYPTMSINSGDKNLPWEKEAYNIKRNTKRNGKK